MSANIESGSRVKAVTFDFNHQYLKIDLAQVSNNVASLVSNSESYFSKPLDQARFQLITSEGMRSEKIAISDTARIFDLVGADTVQIDLYLSVEQKTASGMFTLIGPEEHVNVSIDFRKKAFGLQVCIVGSEKADQIRGLLTEGVVLVTVELPEPHRYIEPFLLSLFGEYPSTELNVFLIMPFKKEPPFPEIVKAVRDTCRERGLNVLRADDREFTGDLWDNVLTYMYACDQAIAIFDNTNSGEFNSNVSMEVGFLRLNANGY
jgi:hypothetical protein